MPRHIITRTYTDLKGFSTDSIYLRTPNISEKAINMVRAADLALSPRRGYQCESADIGGMGVTTYDNPCRCGIEKVCLHRDGNLYRFNEVELNLYFTISNPDVWFDFTIFTNPNQFDNLPGWSFSPWSLTPWASPSGESITFNGYLRNAAIVNGDQSNVNTINVQSGHVVQSGNTIAIFNRITEQFETRTVTGITLTSVTFSGDPVTVSNNDRLDVFVEQLFLKGYDVNTPYPISQFLTVLNSIQGVSAYTTGPTNIPAAFIPIIESTTITSGNSYTLSYGYWQKIPCPINPLLPGSASAVNQNSPDFENATFAVFNEILYCSNGYDFPVKYDGQNSYLAGMPKGDRVSVTDAGAGDLGAGVYQYAITYEQKDNTNYVIEGEISSPFAYTAMASHANDVRIINIASNSGYNTNAAIATGGSTTVYGPDSNGYYYHYVSTSAGQTLLVGDTAYYKDDEIAQVAATGNSTRIPVDPGYGVVIGDVILIEDNGGILRQRQVVDIDTTVSPNVLEIAGGAIDYSNLPAIAAYVEDKVYGHIAIVDGTQNNVTTVNVLTGHTVAIGDIITFVDSSNQVLTRTISNTSGTSVTFSPSVSVTDLTLLATGVIDTDQITLQNKKSTPIVLSASAVLSNNLRINIYRTPANGTEYQLVASIPNNSFSATQTYTDDIIDSERGFAFANPIRLPNPPPKAKYILTYENMVIYAGGSRYPQDTDTSLDAFYFSEGNQPEAVPRSTNFGLVPSNDDIISGVGISGSVLAVFKDRSIYAISGELLTSQYEVIPVAPGSNIGCAAHATIQSNSGLLYFLSLNGVYSMSESQLFPTDKNGRPVPLSRDIDVIFRERAYEPYKRFVFKRAVAINYAVDNQYILFMPAEDVSGTIRNANIHSKIFCYNYQDKEWFEWDNINAAGGFAVFNNDLFWQERRLSGFVGNTSNTYRQHHHDRLIDYADHTEPVRATWSSSWEDLAFPEVRKKFLRCMLLLDRVNSLYQVNLPPLRFHTCLNRYPNLKDTIANVTTVNNSTQWGQPWSWTKWSGLVDSFVRINLKSGTVAKSMQINLAMDALNTSFKFQGFQLEISPDYDKTFVR